MEDTITQRLDEKDMEYVNVLRKVGFGSCSAKVVMALVSGEKTQHELAECTGENQSAVSISLRNLKAENYVSVSELLHNEERGRPRRMYILKSWDAIVDAIERKFIREIEDKKTQIDRLKELIN